MADKPPTKRIILSMFNPYGLMWRIVRYAAHLHGMGLVALGDLAARLDCFFFVCCTNQMSEQRELTTCDV